MAAKNDKLQLGKLEKVDLRSYWEDEGSDFTPWLACETNIRLLGDAIGIELEVETREKGVGSFWADILCKDTATDDWVVIENQLTRTDHGHLGQVLTYAAGLDASTIVWIAERFTDEHRAALDWLNENTNDEVNFFGLEIELWKIGDSLVAPKFNIVSKPNDWNRKPGSAGPAVLTEPKRLQLEFWQGFREYLRETGSPIKASKPSPQHWMNIGLGKTGFGMSAIASFSDSISGTFSGHEIRAEVQITNQYSKGYFALLEEQKTEIEKSMGESLTWYNPKDAQACRIYLRKPANIRDRNSWPALFAWLAEKLAMLQKVFAPRIKSLNAQDAAAVMETNGRSDLS